VGASTSADLARASGYMCVRFTCPQALTHAQSLLFTSCLCTVRRSTSPTPDLPDDSAGASAARGVEADMSTPAEPIAHAAFGAGGVTQAKEPTLTMAAVRVHKPSAGGEDLSQVRAWRHTGRVSNI
jgi:hypothetical protein